MYAGDSLVVAFDPWTLAIAVIIYIVRLDDVLQRGRGKLAMKEGARLCRTIGTWCSSCFRVLGVRVLRRAHHLEVLLQLDAGAHRQ